MFGYILPEKQELKIKEYTLFKAYYCGLCKAIGTRYGFTKRMLLNYDTTFLGLLLSSMLEDSDIIGVERCPVNPIKKKPLIRDNEFVNYGADINILLAYHKFADDWKDGRNLLSLSGMGLLRSAYQKAKKNAPLQEKVIRERLRELSWFEEQKCDSMDQIADVFGRLMKDILIFSPIGRTERERKLLGWMGYNLGRWVYLLDAYDDLEKDIKEKNYNVLLLQYQYAGEDLSLFKEKVEEGVRFNLVHTLGQIGKTYELMDILKNRSLVENIIYLGMYKKTEEIITGRSCKNGQSISSPGSSGRSFRGGDQEGLSGVGEEISSRPIS